MRTGFLLRVLHGIELVQEMKNIFLLELGIYNLDFLTQVKKNFNKKPKVLTIDK